MTYTREQRQVAYKKLPPDIQDFIMSNETTELITDAIKKVRLSEEQSDLADSEILYAMFGLQTLVTAIDNIAKRCNKNVNDLAAFKSELEDKVFSKYKEFGIEIGDFVEASKSSTKEEIMLVEEKGASEETVSIDNLHDENGAENIRNILKANSGEDREKLIENQFKKLPEALQEAIQIVPWRSVVKEIALLNKLDLSQIVAVERETMFVIYGFEDEKNYLANIMKEAKLEEPVAVSITKALNDRVFKVIVNKVGEVKPAPKNIPASLPKTQSDIHPVVEPAFAQGSVMVKKGEVAHEVPHVEQPAEIKEIKKETIPEKPAVVEPAPVITPPLEQPKKESAPLPINHYPDGKDPYREPLV